MIQKRKIVYIDSDENQCQMIKSSLLQKTNKWIFAKTGREGSNLIFKEKPDIVIVDYYLSDMSGEEFYTKILKNPDFKSLNDIPFILISSNGNINKSKMYRLGYYSCIKKPFKSDQLSEFIDDALISNHLRNEDGEFWDSIQNAKSFLESVVESSIEPIFTTDRKGYITYCNKASEELLNFNFDEMVGLNISELLTGGSSELLKIYSSIKNKGKITNYKTFLKGKNYTKIPVIFSLSPMRDIDGNVIGSLVISMYYSDDKDIAETSSSEKLTVILETAIAVNHAINNPLVPILGNAQFLLQDERITDEDIRKRLRVIIKNALRIKDTTQKLARISNPVSKEYTKGTLMLDIDAST